MARGLAWKIMVPLGYVRNSDFKVKDKGDNIEQFKVEIKEKNNDDYDLVALIKINAEPIPNNEQFYSAFSFSIHLNKGFSDLIESITNIIEFNNRRYDSGIKYSIINGLKQI